MFCFALILVWLTAVELLVLIVVFVTRRVMLSDWFGILGWFFLFAVFWFD